MFFSSYSLFRLLKCLSIICTAKSQPEKSLSETDGVSIVDTYQIMTSIKSQLHSVIQLDLDLLLVAFDFDDRSTRIQLSCTLVSIGIETIPAGNDE